MSARGLCPRLGGCGRAPRGLLYEPAARPLPLPRDRRQRRWRMEPGGRLAVLRSAPPFLPDRLVSRRVGGALPAGGPRRTEALHAAVARARAAELARMVGERTRDLQTQKSFLQQVIDM